MTQRLSLCLVACVALTCSATASETRAGAPDLTELSLEELMQIEITSVSKKPEKLSEAAAAVYVLTGDDIRRSGATTIADALRLVPGVQAARMDSNKWAISARGFAHRFSNKLLVLVDGRSVYTPLYSGVYWEVQDLVLDDVERIEIVRGPGGTLWGANAVNGVINIITKNAKDTQGGYVHAGAGTEEKAFGAVRYGGRLGENAWYRVYAKAFDRDGSVDPTGADTNDDWSVRRSGFRIDWQIAPANTLALYGDLYDGEAKQTVMLPIPARPYVTALDDRIAMGGGDLVLRWERTCGDDADMALQVYYDRAERSEALYDYRRNTFDLDFQHRSRVSERHEIVWGLGYRLVGDRIPLGDFEDVTAKEKETTHLYSSFVQDEIVLRPERLVLTVGSKFEHNDYTGFEVQPSARLAWTPSPRRTLWAAVSRAVRTPSRGEATANSTLIGDPRLGDFLPRGVASDELDSEKLLTFELGYRVQPSSQLSLDVATFYNQYDDLLSWEAGVPFVEASPPPPHVILPLFVGDKAEAESYGVELAAEYRPGNWWRLRAGYSFLKVDAHLDADSTDPWAEGDAEGMPQHIAFVHSMMDLTPNLDLDLSVRYQDHITIPWAAVDSYVELDAHLAWRPAEDVELFVVGQSLLHDQHAEARPMMVATQVSDVERSVYAGVTWRF
jgi:iron complex outermembrane receptor protein